jgi:hypothetical protein
LAIEFCFQNLADLIDVECLDDASHLIQFGEHLGEVASRTIQPEFFDEPLLKIRGDSDGTNFYGDDEAAGGVVRTEKFVESGISNVRANQRELKARASPKFTPLKLLRPTSALLLFQFEFASNCPIDNQIRGCGHPLEESHRWHLGTSPEPSEVGQARKPFRSAVCAWKGDRERQHIGYVQLPIRDGENKF